MKGSFLKYLLIFSPALVGLTSILAEGPGTAVNDSSGEGVAVIMSIILMFGMICCLFVPIIAYLGLKIYLSVDAFSRDYGDDNNMLLIGLLLLWFADIFLFVGPLFYYFLIMQKFPKKS
jgi:hypothetical protein